MEILSILRFNVLGSPEIPLVTSMGINFHKLLGFSIGHLSFRESSPKLISLFRKLEVDEIKLWWFQIFFSFTPIWGRFPFWLIFFKGVENQLDNQFYFSQIIGIQLCFCFFEHENLPFLRGSFFLCVCVFRIWGFLSGTFYDHYIHRAKIMEFRAGLPFEVTGHVTVLAVSSKWLHI